MRKYRLVAKKGEGTFSEVLKAQNVKDGKYHAIKCMKNHFDSIDQVNNLREIQALRRLSPHQHIITLEEVLYDQPTGRLALVFELMDANLYELIRGRRHYLNPNLIRSYMFQLVRALHHMHRKGIFHRDIKPENILIENTSEMGRGLKLADFGSCRGIYSKQPYTEYISTRWYRAPECLLTDGYYGPEMDMWGAGCVFFEITSLYPLFPGTNELDQINRIHKVLGTPSPELLAKFKRNGAAHVNFDFPEQQGIGISQLIRHAVPECVDLMKGMLAYDASERTSAREALQHEYYRDIRELEARRQQQMLQQTGGTTLGATDSDARSVGYNSTRSKRMSGDEKALPTISPMVGGGKQQHHQQHVHHQQSGASGRLRQSSDVADSQKPKLKPSMMGKSSQQQSYHHSHYQYGHGKMGGSSMASLPAQGGAGGEEYLPPISGLQQKPKGGTGRNQRNVTEKGFKKKKRAGRNTGGDYDTKGSLNFGVNGTNTGYSSSISRNYSGMSTGASSYYGSGAQKGSHRNNNGRARRIR